VVVDPGDKLGGTAVDEKDRAHDVELASLVSQATRSRETSLGLTRINSSQGGVPLQQTRGMVRHEAKQDRRRRQLPEMALIVGVDIGKTRHAV
jgi:hypothetical protein